MRYELADFEWTAIRSFLPEPGEKRQALRVAAEAVTGVRGVEEHVVPAPLVPAF